MVTKRTVVIRLIFVLFIIIPYTFFIGPNDFFRNLALVFFGFYLLINIIACLKMEHYRWLKCVLNIFDGVLVFLSIAFTIILFILSMKNKEESGFVYILYPILGAIFAFGLLGLFFTNSKKP